MVELYSMGHISNEKATKLALQHIANDIIR